MTEFIEVTCYEIKSMLQYFPIEFFINLRNFFSLSFTQNKNAQIEYHTT